MNGLAIGAASVLRGTIRVGSDSLEYRTSFLSGLRFRCLPGCGLCCRTYRIPLTESDVERLGRVADPAACPAIIFENSREDGGVAAFMENGRGNGCCYLDEDALCTVYGGRPLYCRTYPLIRDTYEGLEMSVDRTCPGVGEGDRLTAGQIEEALLLEGRDRPEVLNLSGYAASYGVICGSLKAMGVYTEAGLMRSVCAQLIRGGLTSLRVSDILSYLNGAAAALAGLPVVGGNIVGAETATRLAEGVEDILGGKTGETKRDSRSGLAAAGSAEPVGNGRRENELSEGATAALADYLAEWIRRQALLRFVHATALARPRRENVLCSFFAFLVHAASRILTGADGLSRQDGETRITARSMLEAIRKNEGPLRSRCASVVSAY